MLAVADRRDGIKRFLSQFPANRQHYAEGIAASGFSAADIVIARTEAATDSWTVGRSIADCASEAGSHWSEFAIDLLHRSEGYVDAIIFGSRESEQQRILSHDSVMIGSDGFSVSTDYPAVIHPRAFGTFPKALRLLVAAGIPWHRAIAKATGLPATKVGLSDRGVIQRRAKADIAIIDPVHFADEATYDHPLRPATGVRHVLVDGVFVLRDGRLTGRRPGRLLLRS